MEKIKALIEKIVLSELKILFEKDEMDLAQSADPAADAAVADVDEENVDEGGGGLEDLAGDVDAAADGTDPAVEGDAPTDETAEDGTDDFGGAGGGFSASGGGGGFGSGSAFGDDSEDSDSDAADEDNKSPSEDQNVMDDTGDPIEMVVNIAKDLRTKTGDSQQILNSVKAAIQEKFSNFNDAAPVIQSLWETGEPVLQVVARKLILFIKGN